MNKVTDMPNDLLLLLQQRPDLSTINSYTRTDARGKVIQHFVKTDDGWFDDTPLYIAAHRPPKDDEWDLSDYYTEDDYE